MLHQGRYIIHGPDDLKITNGLPLLGAVVVDEAHHFMLPRGTQHLQDDLGMAIRTCTYDQTLHPCFCDGSANLGFALRWTEHLCARRPLPRNVKLYAQNGSPLLLSTLL